MTKSHPFRAGSLPPEILEPRRRQLSVSDGVARVSWHDELQSVEESNRTTLAPLPTSFGTKIVVFKTNGYGPSIGMRCIWSLSANSHLGS